jgi:sugar lactone lactonase YvrE
MKQLSLFLAGAVLALLFLACQKDTMVTSDLAVDPVEFRAGPVDYIPLLGYQPEGIAMGKGNTAYVGGFFLGGVLKVNLNTGSTETLVPPSPGLFTIGLAYDARSDLLFAAGGSWGTVKVYDVNSGNLEAVFQLTPPGSPFDVWINDLVVTRTAVYVTNSLGTSLYKIPLGPGGQLPDPNDVEEIPLVGEWVQATVPLPGFSVAYNANGVDATPDGNSLVVANSATGLMYHVDPVTGYAEMIAIDGPPLYYADGVVLRPTDNGDGFWLYVAQNINNVAKVLMDEDLANGTVEANITDPLFDTPSTIGIKGNGLYVVNAGFATYNPFMPHPDVEFSVVRVDK